MVQARHPAWPSGGVWYPPLWCGTWPRSPAAGRPSRHPRRSWRASARTSEQGRDPAAIGNLTLLLISATAPCLWVNIVDICETQSQQSRIAEGDLRSTVDAGEPNLHRDSYITRQIDRFADREVLLTSLCPHLRLPSTFPRPTFCFSPRSLTNFQLSATPCCLPSSPQRLAAAL